MSLNLHEAMLPSLWFVMCRVIVNIRSKTKCGLQYVRTYTYIYTNRLEWDLSNPPVQYIFEVFNVSHQAICIPYTCVTI